MNFMKGLYSSVECCKHHENDWGNHGFEGHRRGNKLESVYMLNAYYVDYTKHKFKVYMNEK